jgi:hypothetical protein
MFYLNQGDSFMSKKAENFPETFAQIIEKLAGKESDLEITFNDLKVNIAGMEPTLNGKISFNIKYYVK